MATFTYDHNPGTEVFAVIERDSKFVVEKATVIQVELVSNLNQDETVSSSYEYLLLVKRNKSTFMSTPDLVFTTEPEALNYVSANI